MNIEIIEQGGKKAALITAKEPLLTDAQSALDLIAGVSWQTGVNLVAIYKEGVGDDFFRLSSGVAGEILQKFVNYNVRLAIMGDFSGYTKGPLHDFLVECNRGRHVFFVPDKEEGLRRLFSV